MSERGRFAVILTVVVLAVVLSIVLAVAVWPKEKPVAEEEFEPVVAAAEPAVKAEEVEEVAPEEPAEEEKPKEAKPQVKEKPAPVAEEVEPVEEVEEIEDIMAALEYQEDFLPSGYSVMDFPSESPMSNPGLLPQEMLDELPEELGTDVQIERAYMCMFSDEETTQYLAYSVFEVASDDDAVSFEEAGTQKMSEQANMFGDSFAIRNYVVAVGGISGSEDAGSELMAKLKAAVNYTD